MIAELAGAIYDAVPPADGIEFTVELDPNEIDGRRLDSLAGAGATRALLGLQDFHPEVQRAIGRPPLDFATVKTVADGLRDRGIGGLDMDLLYGLPHQTPARVAATVQQALSLSPDRVALSGYAHVPRVARRQRVIPAEALPGQQARLRLWETARQLLIWDGYAEIGIDHFARVGDELELAARLGRLRRSFRGYTGDRSAALIGVGASAISRFPQGYAQNEPATSAYHRRVRSGRLATARGHALTAEDRLRGRLIETLLCVFCADLGAVARDAGCALSEARAIAAELERDLPGLVTRRGDDLALSPAGRPLARIVAHRIDAYAGGAATHGSPSRTRGSCRPFRAGCCRDSTRLAPARAPHSLAAGSGRSGHGTDGSTGHQGRPGHRLGGPHRS